MQGPELVYVLYVPATHAVHVQMFAPVYPMLQLQLRLVVCDVSMCPEYKL
jgi:hypothetical protein